MSWHVYLGIRSENSYMSYRKNKNKAQKGKVNRLLKMPMWFYFWNL